MTRRRRSDSSVSSSSDSSRIVDNGGGVDGGSSSTRVPQVGAMVRGIVSRITSYGAFVKVPGYIDGLLHFSRMEESRLDEAEARKILKENEAIYAKVVLVNPGRYSLDIRFVDQEEGTDLDPDNERRIQLEPGIANGVCCDLPAAAQVVTGDNQQERLEVNKVMKAVIIKELKYGVFVKVGNHTGLLPQAKIGKTCSGRFGEKLFVKIVEVQGNGKFNCDARYVDQRTGGDLDPGHQHTNEKLTYNGVVIPKDEFNIEKEEDKSEVKVEPRDRRRDRNRSRSLVKRRRDDASDPVVRKPMQRDRSASAEVRRPNNDRRQRDRSESVVRRPNNDRRQIGRSDSVLRRPRNEQRQRERSESPVRRPNMEKRQRERSESVVRRRNGDNRRERSESPVRRTMNDKRQRERSESVVRRPNKDRTQRDRSESIVRRPNTDKRQRDRSESVVRRPNSDRRQRDRSESVVRRQGGESRRDRSDSVVRRPQSGRDRSESLVRRPNKRSRSRSEEIVRRR